MNVYDWRGRLVRTGAIVGRGGEATVFRVADQPGWLAKIYEPGPRPDYPDKLKWMVEHPPENPTREMGHPSLAWPSGLLYDQRKRLAGYLMPYIQKAVPILGVFNPKRRSETLPLFDRRYLHRTARNLAATVGALHSSGYVVGDLNESNILVTPSALVTLIDTDSFQVQELRGGETVVHYCPVAKIEYTPPELQSIPLTGMTRSSEQDTFSLGVLIFQLLMEGNHPFRSQWLGGGDPPPIEARIAQGGFPYTASPSCPVRPPKNAPDLDLLHPEISELVRRCFVDGHLDPGLRPSPMAWERGIALAEQALVQCPNRHIYSNHLRLCPVCGTLQSIGSRSARGNTYERVAGRGQASQPSKVTPPIATPGGPSPAATRPQTASRGTPAASTPATGTNSQGKQPAGSAGARPSGAPPTTSRARPSGPAAPGAQTSAAAGAGPVGGGSRTTTGSTAQGQSGAAAAGARQYQQAQRAWQTWKYWHAQQPQATPPGPSGMAQQAVRAWQTWKFWQSLQGGSSTPGQAHQTGTSGHAHPGPAQPPKPGQAAGRSGSAAPPSSPAKASTQSQNAATQSTMAGPGTAPLWSFTRMWGWTRPRLLKSLAVGGGLGALVGVLPGAVVGVASWSTGNAAAWSMLWALGGAAGGMMRGWQPGYRMSLQVNKTLGWERVWPVVGMVAGAAIGGSIGLLLGWWAILPVFFGLVTGGWLGSLAGKKLWHAGNRLGWERIWAGIGAASAALIGWMVAHHAGSGGLGGLTDQLASSLAFWIIHQSDSSTLVWAAVGALGGALGGALAGISADLFARFCGLVDS